MRTEWTAICSVVESDPIKWCKPLPIGGFTGRAMSQMLHEVAGVVPKEAVIINDQEVVMELEEEMSIMDVSRVIHGLFHRDGQSIHVDSLVAKKDLVPEIVREQDVNREKQRIGERTSYNKGRLVGTPTANDRDIRECKLSGEKSRKYA